MTNMNTTRLTAFVSGHVQGVGFRWWVTKQAKELGLAGSATNKADGRVEVIAEGAKDNCEELLHRLQDPENSTRPGRVDAVVDQWGEPKGAEGFTQK